MCTIQILGIILINTVVVSLIYYLLSLDKKRCKNNMGYIREQNESYLENNFMSVLESKINKLELLNIGSKFKKGDKLVYKCLKCDEGDCNIDHVIMEYHSSNLKESSGNVSYFQATLLNSDESIVCPEGQLKKYLKPSKNN